MPAVGTARAATPRTRWVALAAVSLANFMAYLDNNVTNVAIPTIQRDLHLSAAGLEWIVSSYLLVLAGLLLVGGRVADVFGRRRVFLIGLTVFTLSSLAAGLADSGGMLIGARAVQGLGAAMMMPATLAIILATFTNAKERAAAIGIWGGIGALALALGPVIGGLISQHIHWGWIFLINVPVGVVTMAVALPSVAESRAERGLAGGSLARRLDFPGLVTSALALFSLTWALIEGQDLGWTSAPDRRRVRGRRRRAGGLPAHRDAHRAPHGRAADLPFPRVQRRDGHDDDLGFRHPRHLLLHLAVPAAGARVLADQGGPGLRADGAVRRRVLRDLPADRRGAQRRTERSRWGCWAWWRASFCSPASAPPPVTGR